MASSKPNPEFLPFHSICEFLTAIHIYADEARKGVCRYVPAVHFCSHLRKDLRQCLIYNSSEKDAKLIGVEYMVPRHVFDTFSAEEQKLWHSHEYEVKSGMLILPKPDGVSDAEWEETELGAMKEIVGLYGKTWHFWEVDAGHEYPFGYPRLMGSATQDGQVDLEEAMSGRNEKFGVHHSLKAQARSDITAPETHPNANSWWQKLA